MEGLPEIFTMSAIDRLHIDRTEQIHRLLIPVNSVDIASSRTGDAGLRYAVAHHLLEGAEAAGRAADSQAFAWYRDAASGWIADMHTPTPVGPRIVVAPDIDSLRRSPIAETPYLVLGPKTRRADDRLVSLGVAAFTLADESGFGSLLSGHGAIVCLLRPKSLGATLDSWTISRLPGTVFTDEIGEATVLARDLIHEAGHNWLNDALAALRIKIDGETTFFSPWKGIDRPAFGFIHACWAFPLTMIYTVSVLNQAGGAVREYLHAYLEQQARLVARTARDHELALRLVPDVDLRDRLRTVYRAALALTA
jgi:HEXXH motif-containing protein